MHDLMFLRRLLIPILSPLVVAVLWLAAWSNENSGPTMKIDGSSAGVPAIPAAALAGNTPLHDAAAIGSADRVAQLVEAGADVNSRNSAGETPLHLAAASGSSTAVQALLDRGADGSMVDNEGRSPLYWAVRSQQSRVISIFLEYLRNERERSGH